MNDLMTLSNELAVAKDDKAIREIEGKLQALEEKIEFLQPAGPTLKTRMPHEVLRDPNGTDPYLSDCNWMMIGDLLPTEYINALYGEKPDPDKNEVRSVFEPTHVLNSGSTGDGGEDDFSLFAKTMDYTTYGYGSKDQYDKACYTKVWNVWDKTTRRLELYADNSWK